jgi:Family of unknown function (DUF6446)
VNGKIVAGFIVVTALLAGGLMYWLQIYAFYEPVTQPAAQEMRLTPIGSDVPEAIVVENFQGIDADSSPLRFRSCFTTPLSLGTLTETYQVYDKADPLLAPGWFDCFDAEQIGSSLKSGDAVAFLSEANIAGGVDRVIAVFPDGRGYAWHQLNGSEEE